MIEIEALSFSLHGKKILENISLSVKKGEKAVIHGDSGSGKTTLMRLLIGIHRPDAGRIRFDGTVLNPRNIKNIHSKLSYIPQKIKGSDLETAREFLLFPLSFRANRQKAANRSRIPELMDRLHLNSDLLDTRTSRLSGGEFQRLSLIRALLLNPPLLLLDEITSAMDEDNRDRAMDLVFEDANRTVLAVSHDSQWIRRGEPKFCLRNGGLFVGKEAD